MRILIVDDSPTVCLVIRKLLSSRGHDVSSVGDLDTLPEHLHTPVDLMLLDLEMIGLAGIAIEDFTETFGVDGANILLHSSHPPEVLQDATDRIGAGDAWLGWTAPLVRSRAPVMITAFVGACAAAIHVSTVGNKAAGANEVFGFMKSLLQ